jgi:ATP-dependent DNA helicase RecQ
VRSYARQQSNTALQEFVLTLIRFVHAEAYASWWPLDMQQLERRMDLPRPRIQKGLDYLAERGLLQWRPPGRAIHLEMQHPRAKQWPVPGDAVKEARTRAEARLKAMIDYAESASCRRQQLLDYFGEDSAPCGRCDVCLGRHDPDPVTPTDEDELRHVLTSIARDKPMQTWLPDQPRYRAQRLLRWLVREQYVEPPAPNATSYTLTSNGQRFVPQSHPEETS